MMTGVESSAVDASWLLANLEIASVQAGADSDIVGSVETLVLAKRHFTLPKATFSLFSSSIRTFTSTKLQERRRRSFHV